MTSPGTWASRSRVTAVLVAVASLVVVTVLVVSSASHSTYAAVAEWADHTWEAVDGDDTLGPLGEMLAGALSPSGEAGGNTATDVSMADLEDVATWLDQSESDTAQTLVTALPTAVAVAPSEDPCAERPRSPRSRLSPAAWTLLRAYVRVYRQQMQWLRDGDPRFKAVLYQCTAAAACGGLGDRLNGIVSAFYLAVLTGRAFFIELTTPLPFNVFFLPRGGLDWTWPPPGWDAYARAGYVAAIDAIDFYNPLEMQLRTRGSNPLLAVNAAPALLVVHTNLQFWMDITGSVEYSDGRSPLYPLVQPVRKSGELYALAVAALLRPTCYLASATREWEERLFGALGPTAPRIGVHLRTGLDPSFHDMHRFPAEHLAAFAARLPDAVAALRARATYDPPVNASAPPVVFVVVDYPPALDAILTQLRAHAALFAAVVTVPLSDALPLTHLERSSSADMATPAGNLRTFLEWSLLRRMDAHLFGRTGYSMSASRTVCVPALYFPAITTAVPDYIFFPRGMCWPQERPADEG
jgi:hypothetical protein